MQLWMKQYKMKALECALLLLGECSTGKNAPYVLQ